MLSCTFYRFSRPHSENEIIERDKQIHRPWQRTKKTVEDDDGGDTIRYLNTLNGTHLYSRIHINMEIYAET